MIWARSATALWLGVALAACSPWDLARLEARHPELARVGAAPLAALVPYFVATGDELVGFVCRWPRTVVLGVTVVGIADADDLAILDRALRAWESAGLGLRFERGRHPAAIAVQFGDPSSEGSGAAWVDCRARPGPGQQLDARLVSARFTLRREAHDWKGQQVRLGTAERLGAALHELGHALGFQGHPARGATVMLRSVDHVRWAGAAALRGEPFRDAALAALYAMPNGSVLARVALPAGRTGPLDAAAGRAAGQGRRDWWIRVGDRAAELHWGPGSTRFTVLGVDQIFKNPQRFEVLLPSS